MRQGKGRRTIRQRVEKGNMAESAKEKIKRETRTSGVCSVNGSEITYALVEIIGRLYFRTNPLCGLPTSLLKATGNWFKYMMLP